jgi:hypothetical protein
VTGEQPRDAAARREERKPVKKLGAIAVGLTVAAYSSMAQLSGTNAVSLIEDNVTNARDTLVPLAIGGAVLFISIAAGKKFWKRIFG